MGGIKKVIDMGFDFKQDYKYPLFLVALVSFFFLPSFFQGKLESLLDSLFFVGLIVTSILLMESKSKLKKAIVIASAQKHRGDHRPGRTILNCVHHGCDHRKISAVG